MDTDLTATTSSIDASNQTSTEGQNGIQSLKNLPFGSAASASQLSPNAFNSTQLDIVKSEIDIFLPIFPELD
ncbi:MAG: hypothetical protein ACI9J4_001173 [Paraglaciecola sp.]|jgi:hypothetical protein